MQFIDHEGEAIARVAGQPVPGLLQHPLLTGAAQHGVEHADVGDQDVRRCLLHIPAGEHLSSIRRREGKGRFSLLVGLRPSRMLIGLELQLGTDSPLQILHSRIRDQHLFDASLTRRLHLLLPLRQGLRASAARDQILELTGAAACRKTSQSPFVLAPVAGPTWCLPGVSPKENPIAL